MELLHKNLSSIILKSFYTVYNTLGNGFLERVYQNALVLELRSRNLSVEVQKQIKVYYKNSLVGEYYADMVINQCVILELKAAESIIPEFENQLINYLKATEMEVGFLLNFGPRPTFSRKVFENKRKTLQPEG